MKLAELNKIQEILGYKFDNPDLLQQAFVRRSYSEERGGQNNEVLEFIGDKALDFAVIRIMMNRFGEIVESKNNLEPRFLNPKYFATEYDEGKFTDIKMDLVNRNTLSRYIKKLGFDRYLVMGKSDIHNGVDKQASVKEDLFEAIIGAVTLDCDYNMDTICTVVSKLIDFESYFDSGSTQEGKVILELQRWVDSVGAGTVEYFTEQTGNVYRCSLKIEKIHLESCGVGATELLAQEDAAQTACEILDESKVFADQYEEEIGEPNEYDSIQQINELRQKGMIYNVNYKFKAGENPDGSMFWQCILTAENMAYEYGGKGSGSTKKEAQHAAAYQFLLALMKYMEVPEI